MSQPNGEGPSTGPDRKPSTLSDAEVASLDASGPKIPGYRILGRLGQGAVGAVYLAEEERLERRVALKLLVDTGADRAARRRFEREARAMATVEHPNVVRVYAFGEVESERGPLPFLAMEYVEGESLATRMARKGALDIAESLGIARQVVEALAAAWRRSIVHRDVKPGNVLMDQRDHVRVCDFGLAKPVHLASTMTATGTSFGTPRYIPPEQALGEPVDFRSDIYSLGVMLWEMLTGDRPFDEHNPHLLIGHHIRDPLPPLEGLGLPRSVDRLVARMTEKDPARRFAEHSELLRAIELAEGLVEHVSGPIERTSRPRSKTEEGSLQPSSAVDSDSKIENAEPADSLAARSGPGSGLALLGGDIELPDLGPLLPGSRANREPSSSRSSLGEPAVEVAQPTESTQAEESTQAAEIAQSVEPAQPEALPPVESLGQHPDGSGSRRTDRFPAESEDSPDSSDGRQPVSSAESSAGSKLRSAFGGAAAVGGGKRPKRAKKSFWQRASSLAKRRVGSGSAGHSKPVDGGKDSASPADDLDELATLSSLDSEHGSDAFVELLGALEERRSKSRERRIKKERRRAGGRLRFEELKKEILQPTLRRLMSELHQQGHPTRLQDLGTRGVRFEFLLDSTPVTRCHLEIEADPSGRVMFRFLQNMSVVAEKLFDIDSVNPELIGTQMAAFLRRGSR